MLADLAFAGALAITNSKPDNTANTALIICFLSAKIYFCRLLKRLKTRNYCCYYNRLTAFRAAYDARITAQNAPS